MPFRNPGDWLVLTGLLFFAVSVFALNWISVSAKPFGAEVYREGYGLFVSPWAWSMVVVLGITLAGLWFVQTRGLVVLGSGLYCIAFSILFYIGTWMRIRAIIGDVVKLARSVPFIGGVLGDIAADFMKNQLAIKVDVGYWLFIPAGLLLTAGGLVRLLGNKGSKTSKEGRRMENTE
ncbi:MAG: hypothetical protein JXA49_10155 [Actinobacteria bacterium]|nr:hypothetical protein [Actinomycetota bacterium]